MTYLWLTRWAPYPPRRGGDIDYSRGLVEALARHAPVEGLVFGGGEAALPQGPVRWTSVEGRPPPRWRSLTSPLPNVAFRHADAAYLARAVEAARGVRAVFVDFIGQFWLVAPLIRALGPDRPPVILVDHNVEQDVRRQMTTAEPRPVMRLALALDTAKAARLETAANRAADALVVLTAADRDAFARLAPGKPALVLAPGYEGPRRAARVIDASTPRTACLMGHHASHHKHMVLERALQALADAGVERTCRIEVAGEGEVDDLRRRFPGFHYVGHAPDAQAYLDTVRLGLVPDAIGGGFKLRALTHAFLRTPMLALDQALAGMEFRSGRDYLGAVDLPALAARLPQALDDLPTLNAVQAHAYATAEAMVDEVDRGRALHAFADRLARDRRTA